MELQTLDAAFKEAGWRCTVGVATDGKTPVYEWEIELEGRVFYVAAAEWEPDEWTVDSWLTRSNNVRLPLADALSNTFFRATTIHGRALLYPVFSRAGVWGEPRTLEEDLADLASCLDTPEALRLAERIAAGLAARERV